MNKREKEHWDAVMKILREKGFRLVAEGETPKPWPFTDPAAMASIQRGMEQAQRGEVIFPAEGETQGASGEEPIPALEGAFMIWKGIGGPMVEIALVREKVYGRREYGGLWQVLGHIPIQATPGEPKTGAPARDEPSPYDEIWVNELDGIPDPQHHFPTKEDAQEFNRKCNSVLIKPVKFIRAPAPTGAREVDPETLTAIAIALRDIAKRENPGRGLWEHMGAHSQEHWRGEALKILSLIPGGAPRGTGEAG